MTAAVQEPRRETVTALPVQPHLVLATMPPPVPTVDEVRTWPGVWSAQERFTGWVVYPDPAQRPEDTLASARKLAEVTGRSVTVERVVIRP